MQSKPSYHFQTSVAAVVSAAAGIVLGLMIDGTHAITRSNADAYFVMQAYASDAVVQFATPSPSFLCAADCVDHDRECGAGVETECIYL